MTRPAHWNRKLFVWHYGLKYKSYFLQIILSQLYFWANSLKLGSMTPPRRRSTKCKVDSTKKTFSCYKRSKHVMSRNIGWLYKLPYFFNNLFTVHNWSDHTFLDVVITQCSAIFQLFASKNQTLLVWRNSCNKYIYQKMEQLTNLTTI